MSVTTVVGSVSKLTSGIPIIGQAVGILGAIGSLGGIFSTGHKSVPLMTNDERADFEEGNLQHWADLINSGKGDKVDTLQNATNNYNELVTAIANEMERLRAGLSPQRTDYVLTMAKRRMSVGSNAVAVQNSAGSALSALGLAGFGGGGQGAQNTTGATADYNGKYLLVIIALLATLGGILIYKLTNKPSYRR
jgi:hypothetical protein